MGKLKNRKDASKDESGESAQEKYNYKGLILNAGRNKVGGTENRRKRKRSKRCGGWMKLWVKRAISVSSV